MSASRAEALLMATDKWIYQGDQDVMAALNVEEKRALGSINREQLEGAHRLHELYSEVLDPAEGGYRIETPAPRLDWSLAGFRR